MVDLRAPAPTGADTYVPQPAAEPLGFPRLAVLKHSPLLMDGGPTGESRYWPEWFTFVHPELATTDVSLNLVDEAWLSTRGQAMLILLPGPASPSSVSESVSKIRNESGLPASDVAAMLGIRRRRLYDLLGGASPSAERERRIHTLAGLIDELAEAASGDAARVRAALLRPDAAGASLFELVSAHNSEGARERVEFLCSELRHGRITGRAQRPSPTLKRRSRSSVASDFLSGYRERDDERA